MTALPILNIETRPVKGFLNTAKYEGSGHSSDTHGAEVPIKTWLNIPYGQANRWEHSVCPHVALAVALRTLHT